MRLSVTVTALVLLSVCARTTAFQTCTSDNDCTGGCCTYAKDGNVCKALGIVGDICDLEGQGLAKDVCRCIPELACKKIDLSDFGDDAAAVNPIFEKHHYGLCEVPGLPIG